jgi:putative Mg2+ transporter-C (MgtC) family protein
MSDWVVMHRLIVTALLAGWIGYERERQGRAAGLRTHILVALGSCLVMLTALDMMEALAGRVTIDPTRMAGQVVSGIGFLGAGTILRSSASILGLTTAASLWVAAGIGLAVGSGFVVGAAMTTVLVLVVLVGLSRWERRFSKGDGGSQQGGEHGTTANS